MPDKIYQIIAHFVCIRDKESSQTQVDQTVYTSTCCTELVVSSLSWIPGKGKSSRGVLYHHWQIDHGSVPVTIQVHSTMTTGLNKAITFPVAL